VSTCDKPCDHLFEAATLSARLLEAEDQRATARQDAERARGLLRTALAEMHAPSDATFRAIYDFLDGATPGPVPGRPTQDFIDGRDAALANAAMVAHDMGYPHVRQAINQLFPEDSPARPIDTPPGNPPTGLVCGDAIEHAIKNGGPVPGRGLDCAPTPEQREAPEYTKRDVEALVSMAVAAVKPFHDFPGIEAALPKTIAGRQECLDAWYHGLPVIDDNGKPTGERTAPLISKDTYLRLSAAIQPTATKPCGTCGGSGSDTSRFPIQGCPTCHGEGMVPA